MSSRRLSTKLLPYVSSALLGCTGGSQSGSEGEQMRSPDSSVQLEDGVEYQRIEGASSSSAVLDLCELVRHPMFEAGGLYTVERMTGVIEEDLHDPGLETAFTYVELTQHASWFGPRGDTTARITGGPLPSGASGAWPVSLAVGEQVGLLLLDRAAENRDLFGLHALGTFNRTPNGGFTNGQLFASTRIDADQLSAMVRSVAESDHDAACPESPPLDAGTSDDDAASD